MIFEKSKFSYIRISPFAARSSGLLCNLDLVIACQPLISNMTKWDTLIARGPDVHNMSLAVQILAIMMLKSFGNMINSVAVLPGSNAQGVS